MGDDERTEMLLDLLKIRRIWDPIPPWLKLDQKLQRQFAQLEVKFQMKELEIQQQKLQEFSKIMGMK